MSGSASAVFTECCGAGIVNTRLNGEEWYECADCGAVLDL